jgi:hypothetical protein
MDFFPYNVNQSILYGEAYKHRAKNAGFPKVYCLDFSWFEDYSCPYPVFSVLTGELITKENYINANHGIMEK